MRIYLSWILLLFSLVFYQFSLVAQTKECNTFYNKVDEVPKFDGGVGGLMRYFNKSLSSTLSGYYQTDSTAITGITILLSINCLGKVVDADFKKVHLTEKCRNKLIEILKKMPRWQPAVLDGKTVGCYFPWVISCILWEE